MRPIPKQLLIHDVMWHKKENTDRWGNGDLDEGQKVQRVRLEPSSKVVRDKNHAEVQLVATLFYDCKNSRPEGAAFALDDIIVFNEEKYQIKTIEPLYDKKKLHHWEMGLIRSA